MIFHFVPSSGLAVIPALFASNEKFDNSPSNPVVMVSFAWRLKWTMGCPVI